MNKFILFIAISLGFIMPAQSGEMIKAGSLEITSPWARASTSTSRPSAAFLTIKNTGTQNDELLEASNPVASMTELHRTTMNNGIMGMEPAGTITIPAGKTVMLKPGGFHIMLMRLKTDLKKGGNTTLELTFKHAGKVTITAKILGPGASGHSMH